MRKIVIQFSVSLALVIGVAMIGFVLLFLIAIGVLFGLFVDVFNSSSRISKRELKEYKIFKRVELDKPVQKTKKVFKLSPSVNLRGKGVVMSPMNEKKLSKAR